MDKDATIQAAEDEWLGTIDHARIMESDLESYSWHWFWLILAESIWPESEAI